MHALGLDEGLEYEAPPGATLAADFAELFEDPAVLVRGVQRLQPTVDGVAMSRAAPLALVLETVDLLSDVPVNVLAIRPGKLGVLGSLARSETLAVDEEEQEKNDARVSDSYFEVWQETTEVSKLLRNEKRERD